MAEGSERSGETRLRTLEKPDLQARSTLRASRVGQPTELVPARTAARRAAVAEDARASQRADPNERVDRQGQRIGEHRDGEPRNIAIGEVPGGILQRVANEGPTGSDYDVAKLDHLTACGLSGLDDPVLNVPSMNAIEVDMGAAEAHERENETSEQGAIHVRLWRDREFACAGRDI